jgi:hypothetical protein
VTPQAVGVAAWGQPPIVLQCGIDVPDGPTSDPCFTVDGVDWIIDNPDGIDGRAGAQISGGFVTVREARDLAALLGSDSLPVDLTLVRQRPSSTQNS